MIKNILFFFFVLFSSLCRYLIPYETNADYGGYENNLLNEFKGLDLTFESLFQEPYYKFLGEVILSLSNNNYLLALNFVYKFNFTLVNLFVIWIAYRKDILFFNKILFFTFYYFLFAYTTIRNTPAYLLISLSFYNIQRNKNGLLGVLSFLAHMSSLLVMFPILSSVIKSRLINMLLLAGGLFSITILITLPFFTLAIEKFNSYSNYSEYGVSTAHKIYYVTFIVTTILLTFFYKAAVVNKIYIYLFVVYILLNAINGVMGYRYSIYVTIFLLLYPYKSSAWINKKLILVTALVPFYLFFIYTYHQNHP